MVNGCEMESKQRELQCHYNMWQTCRKTWGHLWRCNRSTCCMRLPWATSTIFDNHIFIKSSSHLICHHNVQPWQGLARGTSGVAITGTFWYTAFVDVLQPSLYDSFWFFLILYMLHSVHFCSIPSHDLWILWISCHQLRTIPRLWRWFWLKIGTWTLSTSPVPAGGLNRGDIKRAPQGTQNLHATSIYIQKRFQNIPSL